MSRAARGLGLGKEFLRLTTELAKANKLPVYFSGLSGIYSQKIYRAAGFETLREIKYADMKDRKGNLLIQDNREHPSMLMAFKRLTPAPQD